ncbi:MAG: hypothetical protein ABI175_25385 [Polyangiales bacterium]
MRTLLVLALVTAACSDKPAAPDPKAFAAMSEDAKCDAAFPRAKRCVDELMAQQFESLVEPGASEADRKVATEMANEIRKEKSFADEADALHRTSCAASPTYADAVVACWPEPDCKAFATCVIKKDSAMLGPSAKPSTSPSPSSPSPSGTRP